MIEVTNEMLALLREYQMGAYGELDDDCDKRMIAALIELHEANKQHLVTKDAMANCVHVLPMDFVKDLSNGTQNLKHLSEKERDAIVRCIANAVVESCNTTQEPLSEVEILKLALRDFYPLQFKDRSYGIALDKVTVVDFARLIEQAHGIGVTND